MFERILNQLREKVRTRQYVMTLHANEEMDEDDLTILMWKARCYPAACLSAKKTAQQTNGNISSKARISQVISWLLLPKLAQLGNSFL
ncbi:MAG: hypothetical protein WA821_23085 [Anaerolineales bacterium]